ncbi:sensor histidine kinase [Methanoregula sp.]|uniref:sensor histidine kinase n=1 Tax=Methanoregula sp. TaxID=2052170 RepID=UPI003C1B0667
MNLKKINLKKTISALSTDLGIVFFSMIILMSVFELTKQLLNPSISIWESHEITIVFTSVISIVIVFFPLRRSYREQQKAREALAHQRDAEEKFRRSEMQYRSFVESVEDSIYTVDKDLRYLLINARHLVRRGLSPEQYAGKSYADFHSRKETELFMARVQQVISSKRMIQDEYERDGRFFLRKLNPVIDTMDNTVVAVTVISTDITDRKNVERKLEESNRKLNLVNDITRHDILNQMTVLNSYISLGEAQSSDPAVTKYFVRSEQVIETIHKQILFARDYQKIGIASPQWQNAEVTIRHAQKLLPPMAVDTTETCAGMEIFADPLLEKVFYNLLENSLRYAEPDTLIKITCQPDQDHLMFLYEDTGPGISYEEKMKLFIRGYGKNTGLGLFLIREILAITGISIMENGIPGKGCRFEILIPKSGYRPGSGIPIE